MESTKSFLRSWTSAEARRLVAWIAASAAIGLPAESQSLAYVTNNSSTSVSVVDTSDDFLVATIPLGATPSNVALSPDGTRAYVSHATTGAVSVIESGSQTVVANFPVGAGASTVRVTPDGTQLYVMLSNGNVAIVDLAQQAVLSTVAVGSSPLGGGTGIAFAPDGSRAYVASGSLSVIDTAARTLIGSFYVGNGPDAVAVSPDGTHAYISNAFGSDPGWNTLRGTIAVFDTTSLTVLQAIPFWALPTSIALTPDGSRAFVSAPAIFVTNGYTLGFLPYQYVATLDTATGTISNWTLVGHPPGELAVTPDGARVFVAIPIDGTLAVIDAASSALIDDVGVGTGPGAVAIGPQSCPPPASYCTAGVSSNGCVVHMSSSGSGANVVLTASPVDGQRVGLIFYGVTGANPTPWGTGSSYLCVDAPRQRTGTQNSGGNDGACDGALSLDFGAFLASHPSALGQPFATHTSVWTQAWFRDPPAPKGTSLSDALRFDVCP